MEWRLSKVRNRSLSVAARIGFHKSTASMKLVGNIQRAFIFKKLKLLEDHGKAATEGAFGREYIAWPIRRLNRHVTLSQQVVEIGESFNLDRQNPRRRKRLHNNHVQIGTCLSQSPIVRINGHEEFVLDPLIGRADLRRCRRNGCAHLQHKSVPAMSLNQVPKSLGIFGGQIIGNSPQPSSEAVTQNEQLIFRQLGSNGGPRARRGVIAPAQEIAV